MNCFWPVVEVLDVEPWFAVFLLEIALDEADVDQQTMVAQFRCNEELRAMIAESSSRAGRRRKAKKKR